MRAIFVKIIIGLVMGLLPLSFAQAQEEPSKTILVFDASGSMWGQIDGKAKITIARSVFENVLKDWQAGNELGLIAYGHRRKGDCTDIEQIIAPGPVDKDAFMTALNSLNPKGKTPLSAAVKQAAEALKFEENKASVILVTDGLETCNADPCAMASELEKLGVDFTTHVIGFDLGEKETKAVRCIAENTGGQYFPASNAGELGAAMEIVSEAATHEYNVLLHGKINKDAEELTDGVSWEVYPYTNGKLAADYLTYSYNAPASLNLPPGQYRIKAVHGKAIVYQDFEVKDEGLNEAELLFGTGTLIVSGRADKNASEPVGKEWDIYPIIDGEVSKKYIGFSYHVPATFILPAGKYRIKAIYGKAIVYKDVEIKTGETTKAVIIFNTGTLEVSGLAGQSSQKPVGKEWDIYPIIDGVVSKKYIGFSYRIPGKFILPTGQYRIKAIYGKAIVYKDVAIKADETTKAVIIFNTGMLEVSGRAGGAQKPVGKEWDIYPMVDGQPAKNYLTYSYKTPARFILPAGDYWIRAIYDGKTYTQNVTIKTDTSASIVMQFD